MKNTRLEERRKRIPQDVDIYVKRSFQIVDRIHEILENQGKDQKSIALLLGKSESEVSKWMNGTHNFTLKTLSKIEAVLGEKILFISEREERYFLNMWTTSNSHDNFFFKGCFNNLKAISDDAIHSSSIYPNESQMKWESCLLDS